LSRLRFTSPRQGIERFRRSGLRPGNIAPDFGSNASKLRGMWNWRHAARVLEKAMHDVGATTGWILDQADGNDTLRPGLIRRNFAGTPEWLP